MFFYLLIGTVLAQDKQIEYQKRTEIDFEALDIEGEMIKPKGSIIMERTRTKFNPLIELRTDWNHEMNDSVREVK
tara:strand:- start:4504 stop:4728 length:225 start_codon:yes stop_codon:yes gene_type:complete